MELWKSCHTTADKEQLTNRIAHITLILHLAIRDDFSYSFFSFSFRPHLAPDDFYRRSRMVANVIGGTSRPSRRSLAERSGCTQVRAAACRLSQDTYFPQVKRRKGGLSFNEH